MTVKSTIAIELKKQYELAKIEEIKNISIVNVLDPARPPVKKERPKRATNAALAFLAHPRRHGHVVRDEAGVGGEGS